MSKMIYSILYEETSVTNIQILKYMPNNIFLFLKDYLCFKFWVYELFIKIFLTKIDATNKFLMPAKMTWISQEKDILNAILENNAIWRVYSITASSQPDTETTCQVSFFSISSSMPHRAFGSWFGSSLHHIVILWNTFIPPPLFIIDKSSIIGVSATKSIATILIAIENINYQVADKYTDGRFRG